MKKMKSKYINYVCGLSLLFIGLVSCEPIEENNSYQNDFNPDNIEIEAIQETEGSNGITLKMNTHGVTGYWDYVLDKQYTDEVSFNYPIPGEVTFTFHATTPYAQDKAMTNMIYAEKSVKVNITKLDKELPVQYYQLVGENLDGKTWVFDGTKDDNQLWWYMSPGNDPASYETAWWNAGGTGAQPADYDGKMVFDLAGAANYTYYASQTAAPSTGGTWAFNKDFTKLTINGENKILGNEEPRGNADGIYTIISLTSDKMILYVPNNGGGTGWTWVFKPENK